MITTWNLSDKTDVAYYSDVEFTADELHTIELWFRQTSGENTLILSWESDTIEKDPIPSMYLFNTLYSETTPFSFTVLPAITNPLSSTIDGTDYLLALDGIEETLFLHAKDYYEN